MEIGDLLVFVDLDQVLCVHALTLRVHEQLENVVNNLRLVGFEKRKDKRLLDEVLQLELLPLLDDKLDELPDFLWVASFAALHGFLELLCSKDSVAVLVNVLEHVAELGAVFFGGQKRGEVPVQRRLQFLRLPCHHHVFLLLGATHRNEILLQLLLVVFVVLSHPFVVHYVFGCAPLFGLHFEHFLDHFRNQHAEVVELLSIQVDKLLPRNVLVLFYQLIF